MKSVQVVKVGTPKDTGTPNVEKIEIDTAPIAD
jgi:hypothetical protein